MSATTPEPARVLAALLKELAGRGIDDVALTGGLAFGAWVALRHTKDFDFCAAVPGAAVAPLLARYDGIAVGPERIPSTIRFEYAGWSVDIFVARTDYDRECLRRAVVAEVLGVKVKVVTPEDLLIHKLIKLRDDKRRLLQDAADIEAILQTCSLDGSYFARWLPAAEAEWLEEARRLDSASLVAWLQKLG